MLRTTHGSVDETCAGGNSVGAWGLYGSSRNQGLFWGSGRLWREIPCFNILRIHRGELRGPHLRSACTTGGRAEQNHNAIEVVLIVEFKVRLFGEGPNGC